MGRVYRVNLNMSRGGLNSLQPDGEDAEARRTVKLFLVPADATQAISDDMVPDFLVADSMVRRYLEIEPPIAAVISRIPDDHQRD